jgi:hypothetical protein
VFISGSLLLAAKAENTVMSITPSPAAVSDAATAVAWQQSKLIRLSKLG